MEATFSRVLFLLCFFPLGLLSAPAAQDDDKTHHSIQFPGHDTFLAIAGLNNKSDTFRLTDRPIASTTYRPTSTYGFAEGAVLTDLPTNKPVRVNTEFSANKPSRENEPVDCTDNYFWENVSPYDQEKQSSNQVDTRLSIEAMFTITNRIEALILDKTVNLIFSPIGLTSVLGQLMLAARGKTLYELEKLLAPGKSSCHDGAANKFHHSFRSLVSQLWRRRGSQSYELSARNALFYQSPGQTLDRNFTRRLSAEYATEIFSSDFRNNPEFSLRQMNSWASGASRGKISQLVPEVPSRSTTAVISSVTYFKASWENVFNKQFTGPGPFYLDGDRSGRVKTVDFMVAEFEVPYAESAALGCRIMALPYTNNETVLYVVMPLGPPKRRRPNPVAPTPIPNPSPQVQTEDTLLLSRIQEVEPERPSVQGSYGNKINPPYSPGVTKTPPQTFFYLSDSVVYPGPHVFMSTFIQQTLQPITRSRRQQDPCSGNVQATSATAAAIWRNSGTTLLPCLEERSSEPRAESLLSPSNVHKLSSRLGPSEFSRLVSEMRVRRVSVILPKVSLSSNVKLKDTLSSLGLNSVFSSDADLSGAVEGAEEEAKEGSNPKWPRGRKEGGWWKVDEVWQQSRIELDEYGVEAASGTAVGIVDYGGDSVVFKANSPFLAVVRHEATGAPIFWACVVDPS